MWSEEPQVLQPKIDKVCTETYKAALTILAVRDELDYMEKGTVSHVG
jgi:hypothetical protein